MMTPEVVNLRTCKDFGKPGDIRIDRTTKWGNPFLMADNSLKERNRVCDAYAIWFENQDSLKISDLAGAKRLGCWCAPLRCHGDYLAKKIEEYLENKTIKIISGGQTGVDQGALLAAYDLGILTGGYIIRGFGTEKGPMPELLPHLDLYQLIQGIMWNAHGKILKCQM